MPVKCCHDTLERHLYQHPGPSAIVASQRSHQQPKPWSYLEPQAMCRQEKQEVFWKGRFLFIRRLFKFFVYMYIYYIYILISSNDSRWFCFFNFMDHWQIDHWDLNLNIKRIWAPLGLSLVFMSGIRSVFYFTLSDWNSGSTNMRINKQCEPENPKNKLDIWSQLVMKGWGCMSLRFFGYDRPYKVIALWQYRLFHFNINVLSCVVFIVQIMISILSCQGSGQ